VKRRPRLVLGSEVASELLDGWVLVQLLKMDNPDRQLRRLQAHLTTAAVLPLSDCGCHVCVSLRGQISNA